MKPGVVSFTFVINAENENLAHKHKNAIPHRYTPLLGYKKDVSCRPSQVKTVWTLDWLSIWSVCAVEGAVFYMACRAWSLYSVLLVHVKTMVLTITGPHEAYSWAITYCQILKEKHQMQLLSVYGQHKKSQH